MVGPPRRIFARTGCRDIPTHSGLPLLRPVCQRRCMSESSRSPGLGSTAPPAGCRGTYFRRFLPCPGSHSNPASWYRYTQALESRRRRCRRPCSRDFQIRSSSWCRNTWRLLVHNRFRWDSTAHSRRRTGTDYHSIRDQRRHSRFCSKSCPGHSTASTSSRSLREVHIHFHSTCLPLRRPCFHSKSRQVQCSAHFICI
ncbi:hypothetical protein VTK73DRAFT_269 [Phialemonium thermophilum]|uniref:Uncharacterized protein n=1 Tax=Phialemonium thermophilum TaxID=223376 RepID=A0ABR3XFN0_9PEZI